MARIPGRKNFVWVTQGIPIVGFARDSTSGTKLDFTNTLRSFSQGLEQAQIVVYTVAQSMGGATVGTPSVQTLEQFTSITGGREYASDHAGDAIRQAMIDSRANYEVAYYTAAPKPDGKQHKIRIVCARSEVRLQTVAGFYGLPSPVSPAAGGADSAELPREMGVAAHSAIDATEIGLRARVAPDPGDAGKKRVEVHINAADLLPGPAPDPGAGKVSVAFVSYNELLKPLAEPVLVSLTHEQVQKATEGEITLNQALPVPQGVRQVRVIVFDADLGALGSVTIPI